MRVLKRAQHVGQHPQGHPEGRHLTPAGERALHVAQVHAWHVLHRQEVLFSHLAEVVDLGDVLLLQLRADARLVREHAHEGLVVQVARLDALDDEKTHESRVVHRAAGELYVGHAAAAQVLQQHIGAEGEGVGGLRHGPEHSATWSGLRPSLTLRLWRRVRPGFVACGALCSCVERQPRRRSTANFR